MQQKFEFEHQLSICSTPPIKAQQSCTRSNAFLAGVAGMGHSGPVATKRSSENAFVAARPVRYPVQYLLPECRLLQPAAAADTGSRPRRGRTQGPALDAPGQLCQRAV